MRRRIYESFYEKYDFKYLGVRIAFWGLEIATPIILQFLIFVYILIGHP